MRKVLRLTMFVVFVMHEVFASEQNDCGNTSFSGSEGVVTSPHFPLLYPHDVRCTYSIDVGRNNSVILNFIEFHMGPPNYETGCSNVWLSIWCNEGDDDYLDFEKRYCGTDLPRSLQLFHCPVADLTFVTNDGGKFAIEYTVFQKVDDSAGISDLDCGETMFTDSSGVISIPTNPTEYSASVNCDYTITTNDTRSGISIGITAFPSGDLIDSIADCFNEYIEIDCVSDTEAELTQSTERSYCRRSSYLPENSYMFFPNCRTLKLSIRSHDYTYRGDNNIPFTVRGYDEECGPAVYSGPTGIISSPRFPIAHRGILNCGYSIDVDRTKTISLEFISYDLQGTEYHTRIEKCTDHTDFLAVSCSSGDSVPSDQNRKYCIKTTGKISLNFSNCDSLTINFVSYPYHERGGFQIRYTITSAEHTMPPTTDVPDVDCGNTSFTGPTGIIASPQFPLSYPNNVKCIYSIEVDRSKFVVVRFISFNVEGDSRQIDRDRCNYDWLEISCSARGSAVSRDSDQSERYCGAKETPLTFDYSNCDSLTLNFVTDSAITSGGFQLKYTIITPDKPDCGDTLFSGTNGVITSPRYPSAYPRSISCTYSIDAGRDSSVLLKFVHFKLSASYSAGYCIDWLMISCNETPREKSNQYKKYCGSIEWTSPLRVFDCPSVLLEFFSNSSSSDEGFLIEYNVIKNSNSTIDNNELDCGTTLFTNSSGVISLPRNSRNYLATVNCTYTISANSPSYISVQAYHAFSEGLLDLFEDCETDRMTIGCVSDGKTELNPNTILVLCRRGRDTFYDSWNGFVFDDCRTVKMSIRSSNYDYTRAAFEIRFSISGEDELCGNRSLSAPSGLLSPKHYYWLEERSVNCLYIIESSRASPVYVALSPMRSRTNMKETRFCRGGASLTITCLVNGTSVVHLQTQLCDIEQLTTKRFPACRNVLINYTNDHIPHHDGFSISYRMGYYDPVCSNESFQDATGFITSPLFPLNYPNNINCFYSINGGLRKTISLTFLSFRVEGTSNTPSEDECNDDWLTMSCLSDANEISDLSSSRRYCGSKRTPLSFTFENCDVLVLAFRSNEIGSRGGFKVHYTVIDTDTEQTTIIAVSTESPITQSVKCDANCRTSGHETTSDYSSTHSAVVNTQMALRGLQNEHVIVISLTFFVLLNVAVCLGAFLLVKRHRKKNRSDLLLEARDAEPLQPELGDDTAKEESLFGAQRKENPEASTYLPLRQMSLNDHAQPSPSSNSAQNLSEILPGLQ